MQIPKQLQEPSEIFQHIIYGQIVTKKPIHPKEHLLYSMEASKSYKNYYANYCQDIR